MSQLNFANLTSEYINNLLNEYIEASIKMNN